MPANISIIEIKEVFNAFMCLQSKAEKALYTAAVHKLFKVFDSCQDFCKVPL